MGTGWNMVRFSRNFNKGEEDLMAQFDVLVAGDYCLDLIFTGLPSLPVLGKEIVASGFEMLPGATYNSVAAMHRLGLRVAWASDFGTDEFSRFVLERSRAEGLTDRYFVLHHQPLRNITVAASYPEDRAFMAFYDPPPKIPAAVKALGSIQTNLVYLPGMFFGPLFDAAEAILTARKIRVVMDGNAWERETLKNPAVRRAIQRVDVFIPNAREALWLTGENDLLTALRMLSELCPQVVVKDGANGAYAMDHKRVIHVPALKLSPLDTTGAGDCFNAGYVKAMLAGKSLHERLQWGVITGGLSTLGMGGTGKRVTEEMVQEWLPKLEIPESFDSFSKDRKSD